MFFLQHSVLLESKCKYQKNNQITLFRLYQFASCQGQGAEFYSLKQEHELNSLNICPIVYDMAIAIGGRRGREDLAKSMKCFNPFKIVNKATSNNECYALTIRPSIFVCTPAISLLYGHGVQLKMRSQCWRGCDKRQLHHEQFEEQ